MEINNEEKNRNLKTLLIFIFVLAAIISAVWFLGWQVKQGEVILQK